MSENAVEVLTAFLVVVDRSGTVSVHASDLPNVTVDRVATLYDVETYCAKATKDANRLLMQEMLKVPVPESTPDKVAKAVTRRRTEKRPS